MIELSLEHGVCLVDDADAELVLAYPWRSRDNQRHTFYVVTSATLFGGKGTVLLHRLILKPPPGHETDHRNRNGLDNRRGNLRVATLSQNKANGGPNSKNNTGYRGVSLYKRDGTFAARIRNHHLAYFPTAWEAAQAYNRAALELWGEFAHQNVELP
jgi:hypothetical protein